MIGLERLTAAIVAPETSILDAVKAIENGGIQAVLVVSPDNVLLGVATDGDVRRGILHGFGLDKPVSAIMNPQPSTLRAPASREQAAVLMARGHIRQVPVLGERGRIIGVHHIDHLHDEAAAHKDTWVVIMAGGRGTRLHPLTETTPKPMIPIGGQPLLETIIRTLISQGFRQFRLSVNYMAEMFKSHFGDGSWLGADIRYIEETTRLGTAGALGNMSERPPGPFLVMNADLLTAVNLNNLMSFHTEHRAMATMCVRNYQMQVPYGVIEMDGGRVLSIVEKPTKTYFVNAGIYVLNPALISRVKPGEYLDMPTLLSAAIAAGDLVCSFPIHEYWLDIGRFDDLERAQAEYDAVFGG